MFPIYTLIPFAAAYTISKTTKAVCRVLRIGSKGRQYLLVLIVCGSAALSAMRAEAQRAYYAAPLQLYNDLSTAALGHGPYTLPPARSSDGIRLVCVGNEWYRFPASFFLPDGKVRLRFIRDGFQGQLPAHFTSAWPEGSRKVHDHFNGRNKEEFSRYVKLSECDLLVDLLPIPGADDEQSRRALHRGLTPLRRYRFLDAARSPGLTRALYVPGLSERRNAYAEYALLARG